MLILIRWRKENVIIRTFTYYKYEVEGKAMFVLSLTVSIILALCFFSQESLENESAFSNLTEINYGKKCFETS